MDMPSAADRVPSRAASLDRLTAFRPLMGGAYAKRRNFDMGPGAHDGVSQLSPWVRRRLVTEREVVDAAVSAHGAATAEKFVQEVFWRTYFKGWLEGRPTVWADYLGGLDADLDALAGDRRLARRVAEAEEGCTGLACFDAWARELVQTGYLHNHARMWFASIWVFTLGLPWRVGADFFLRHLLDGDPASNTLGWRWVSGLHTRGKAYAAQAWNIEKFTGGRFSPSRRDFADVEALEEARGPPPAEPPRPPLVPERGRPSALLIHEDDCRPEDLVARPEDFLAVATLRATPGRSPRGPSAAVAAFDAGALADADARMQARGAPRARHLLADEPKALVEWARSAGANQIVTPFVPVGPVRDFLDRAAPDLARADIRVAEIRRDWDSLIWPHATAGFFRVRKKIPAVLAQLS